MRFYGRGQVPVMNRSYQESRMSRSVPSQITVISPVYPPREMA